MYSFASSSVLSNSARSRAISLAGLRMLSYSVTRYFKRPAAAQPLLPKYTVTGWVVFTFDLRSSHCLLREKRSKNSGRILRARDDMTDRSAAG